ncbi:HAD-IIA family hydrolase [Leucobacter rhizosphaerae]|uniref:HAD-IIA family hydrolase n=1 Tax=Leucobacter rhizosphaerae TaxID=2932245 RepID=A0ABY4FZ97_9MICO|nr:HAD-IIA family hydrolase [Leucobacter rhizosphaerae]UOQ61561.1 HAD-IIA family hydrolase [Leucobacter rhizosphaerae]
MAFWKKDAPLDPAPIAGRDLLLTDLDGVVYRGPGAIPGAVEQLNRAEARIGYVTNNASRTDRVVAEHLRGLGLRAEASDVVTSPQAAVALLAQTVPAGSRVLVIGGEGLTDELGKAGFEITRSADDQPDAVVQGFDPSVGWEQLAEASFALAEVPGRPQLPWIATNTDWTIPVARGLAPGNGTLVSAVHTAVQRLPVFAGKPETAIFEAAFDRFGSRNALMIGDRLDTDIKGARAAGIPSLHVLTGVDRPKQLVAASRDMQPDFVVASLAELHEPYPSTEHLKDGSMRVGSARVRMDGHVASVVAEGDTPLNLLRAGCAAIWASGLAIYGLQVPEIIFEDHWS